MSVPQLASCSKEVLWKTSAESPDGKWTAAAHTTVWDGPGSGAVGTSVDLTPTNHSREAYDVIVYREGATLTHPQLRWRGQTDLLICVPANKELDLRVVQYSGIRIAVKELPSNGDSCG